MANEISGVKSYLTMAAEATWGTTPGSPTYMHLPADSYDVKFNREHRNAALYLGIRPQKHGKAWRGMCQGSLTTAFYGTSPDSSKSLAQYLLEWAHDESSLNLPSKLIEFAEGPDVANQRHNGLRVNQMTLAGDAQSGRVTFQLDLMGKSEALVATAQTLPNDREGCVEAEFLDCTCSIFGGAKDIEAFQWTLTNNLKAAYTAGSGGGTTPSLLTAGDWVSTLMVRLIKNSDTYAAYQRAIAEQETTATLVIKGLHNGTMGAGNYSQVSLAFNRLRFVEAGEQRNRDDLFREGLMFNVLKPDSSSAAVTQTWSTPS